MSNNDKAKLRRFIEIMKDEEEKKYKEFCDSIDEIINRDKNKEVEK